MQNFLAAIEVRLLRARVIEAGRGELSFNRMLESIQICGTLKKAKTAEIAAAPDANGEADDRPLAELGR